MSLRRLATATTLALTLWSCTANDDGSPAAAGSPAPEPGGYEDVAIAPRPAPTIEVSDVGREPRLPMRLHPEVGSTETLELSMGMRMSMRNGAQDMPNIPVPTTTTRLSSKVEGIEGGVLSLRQAVVSVDVVAVAGTPPEVLDKVRESVEPLRQYRAEMRMDERGGVLGGHAEIPRGLPPMVHGTMQQMTESLGQLAVPLPEPALGAGAAWSAVSDMEQNGMKLRQTAHYVLVSRDGDRAVIEVSLAQELLDPEVSVPGMLGAKTRVGRFDSKGSGVIELDLAHVNPTSTTMTIDLSMTMDVTMLGQNQHVEMDMGIDMTMARTDGAG